MPPLALLQPLPEQTFSDMINHNLAPPSATETSALDSSQHPHSHSFSSALPSDTSDNAPLPRPPSRLTLGPASLNTDEITARAIVPQLPSHHAYHPFKKFIIDDEKENKWPHSLIPLDRLDALNERSLSMQLYKSYQTVLACQEAMWDELMFRLSNKKDELFLLGWNDKGLGELHARQKFEMLLERFRRYVILRRWCRNFLTYEIIATCRPD